MRPGDDYFRFKRARLRFLQRCKIVGECWEWQGVRRGKYGVVRLNGRLRNAHRAAYALFKGPVDLGVSVLHSCKNPLCCAPHHLYLAIQEQPLTPGVAMGAV